MSVSLRQQLKTLKQANPYLDTAEPTRLSENLEQQLSDQIGTMNKVFRKSVATRYEPAEFNQLMAEQARKTLALVPQGGKLVVLDRGTTANRWGFAIALDDSGAKVISRIDSGSLAEGELGVGDRLMSINSKLVDEGDLDMAVYQINSAVELDLVVFPASTDALMEHSETGPDAPPAGSAAEVTATDHPESLPLAVQVAPREHMAQRGQVSLATKSGDVSKYTAPEPRQGPAAVMSRYTTSPVQVAGTPEAEVAGTPEDCPELNTALAEPKTEVPASEESERVRSNVADQTEPLTYEVASSRRTMVMDGERIHDTVFQLNSSTKKRSADHGTVPKTILEPHSATSVTNVSPSAHLNSPQVTTGLPAVYEVASTRRTMIMDGKNIYDTASRAPPVGWISEDSRMEKSPQTSLLTGVLHQSSISPPRTTSTKIVLDDSGGRGSFGFEMVEFDDGSKHVSKVTPGKSAADKLRVGDWVAAVNGEPIDGDTLEVAVSKVLSSPKRVVLQTEAATSSSKFKASRYSLQQSRISEASIPRYTTGGDEATPSKVRISNFTVESDGTSQTMTIALSRNSPMTEFGFTVAEHNNGTKYVHFVHSAPPGLLALSKLRTWHVGL